MQNIHFDYGLFLISELLAAERKTLADCKLPDPIVEWKHPKENPLIAEELCHSPREDPHELEQLVASLNLQQQNCYNRSLIFTYRNENFVWNVE